jgi:hypothetical protein
VAVTFCALALFVLYPGTRRGASRSSARCSVRAAWGSRSISLPRCCGFGRSRLQCGAPVREGARVRARGLLAYAPCF